MKDKGVFVYGTLRKGSYNAPLLAGAECWPAETEGKLFLHKATKAFPVFVNDGVNGVKGDFYPDVSLEQIYDIVQMELAVGYYLDRIKVKIDTGLQTKFVTPVADAWVFAWKEKDGVGAPIASGDWLNVGLIAAGKPSSRGLLTTRGYYD